jgi:AcrR family transcriptional regulator
MASKSSGVGPVPAADGRRGELIRIAGAVFSHAGYAGTSLRDVADAAGIQTGSLYHHFPSKESMAIELVEAFHAEIDAIAEIPDGEPGRPLDDIAEFADLVGGVVERHRAAVHMCMYDAPSTATDALGDLVRRDWTSLDRRWSVLLGAARRAGQLRSEIDLGSLCFVLRTAVFDLASLPDFGSLREGVRSLVSLLLYGLAPERPSFAELDESAPLLAAREVIGGWAEPGGPRGRRDDILAGARSEFARRGYEATTVRDIAQAADIRPSSLYRHFASKREMLQGIMERFSGRLLAGYEAAVAARGSAVERLDALLQVMVASAELFWPEMIIVKDWWRDLGLEGAESPPPDNSSRLRLLESVIEEGIGSGQFVWSGDISLVTLALREVLWIPLREPGAAEAADRRALLRMCLLDGAVVRP